MKTQTTVVTSAELYTLLNDAGLLPGQCTDFIIEGTLGGVVKIHCAMFPDALPKVIAARVVTEDPQANVAAEPARVGISNEEYNLRAAIAAESQASTGEKIREMGDRQTLAIEAIAVLLADIRDCLTK